jgi:hypothetical protein
MATYGQLNDYQSRCRQELLRLRILAGSQDGTALPWEFTVDVRDATNAVIAEVEAISRTAIRASEQLEPQAETFLWVRVARLAAAADRAVDAARSRDVPGLRACLQQFDTLTSALWAVQHATYGNLTDSSPRREAKLRRAAGRTAWSCPARQRGDHEGLDGMHPVFRLVEDDRGGRFEDLVGDLQRLQACPCRFPIRAGLAGSAGT